MRHSLVLRPARLAVALGLAMAVFVPGLASANPPIRSTETSINLDCPTIVTADGALNAFAFSSDVGFAEAGLNYWTEEQSPTSTEPPLLSGFTDQVVVSGLDLTASMPLFLIDGTEVGTGTVEVTMVPVGEPEPFETRFPHFRESGTTQLATITGTATLDASGVLPDTLTFDLASCTGIITMVTSFSVLPDTIRDRHQELRMDCALDNGGETVFVNAFALLFRGEPVFSFVSSVHFPEGAEEPSVTGGTQEPFTVDGINASWDLFELNSGEVAGSATLSATFTPAAVTTGTRRTQDYTQKIAATTLAVSGTYHSEVGTATADLDLSSCSAQYLDIRASFHSPSGPKPGGTPPENDTPDGAIGLQAGSTFTEKTGGAAVEEEVPCVASDGFPFDLGRTVWFTVEGTGGPITVDPTGTDFDTVIGAYAADGGDLVPIDCIDDDFSTPIQVPQAALTIDTAAGTTYYFQVGGFDSGQGGEFGRLRIAVQ
jgi:hypothetical protein